MEGFSARLSSLPRTLTLEPIADESLTSYIFRLASYRRLKSARALASACGFDHYNDQPRADCLTALAETSAMDVSTLAVITKGPQDPQYGWWRGQRFSSSALERRGMADRRLCPECLADSCHHRQIWDIKYIACCPIHRRLLIDECPGCGKPIMWRGRDLERCRCKQDFRAFEAPMVSAADADVTAAVYGLLEEPQFQVEANRVRVMPPFQDLVGSDIADFLFRLGLERLGRRRKAFSTEHLGELAWEAHVALRLGLAAVEDWPEGFNQAIDNMRERWGGNTPKTLFRCVGAIDFWLGRLQEGSQGTAIKAAVVDYCVRDAVRHGRRSPTKLSMRDW